MLRRCVRTRPAGASWGCDTEILRRVPGGTPGTAGQDARAPRKREESGLAPQAQRYAEDCGVGGICSLPRGEFPMLGACRNGSKCSSGFCCCRCALERRRRGEFHQGKSLNEPEDRGRTLLQLRGCTDGGSGSGVTLPRWRGPRRSILRYDQCFRDAHYGFLPRICKASPRTSDICSLNSTNASNTSLSDSCKSPSLLRSISS